MLKLLEICTAVIMPIVRKLADTFGFKLLFFIGIGLFLGGSALCGTSGSMMQLILFRGIQGIGAGILSANTLGIIGVTFSPVERAKYMGLGSSVYALASIVGRSLGGFTTDNFSWRWIFCINIPLGIIAMTFIFLKMPNVKNGIEKKVIDFLGIMVFVLAVICHHISFVAVLITYSFWCDLHNVNNVVNPRQLHYYIFIIN